MARIIEIDGGLVSIVSRSVETSIPLEEWVQSIERRSPLMLPTLPVGTKAVYYDPTDRNQERFAVLIERDPHIFTMNYGTRNYELSLPYVRFFFQATTRNPESNLEWSLTDYRVFFAKTPYVNPSTSDMIAALLPNVYEDGRICFGSTAADADQTIAQRLNQTVNEFFLSRFNGDLHIRRPNGAPSYTSWLAMTQNDPTAWVDWTDWSNPSRWSLEMLARNMRPESRFEPMVAADPIPEVPLGATFGRITEWLQTMTPIQRTRFIAAATAFPEEPAPQEPEDAAAE